MVQVKRIIGVLNFVLGSLGAFFASQGHPLIGLYVTEVAILLNGAWHVYEGNGQPVQTPATASK